MPSRKPKDDEETPSVDYHDTEEFSLHPRTVAEHVLTELAEEESTADTAKAEPVCPLCHAVLIKHEGGGFKVGASHCNNCGSCWAEGLKEQRKGHSAPTSWTMVD